MVDHSTRFHLGPRLIATLTRLTVATCVVALLSGAKAKKDSDSDKDSKTADSPTTVTVTLPTDLNEASLRVAAIDTIYQLDLSVAQLHQLTAASGDTAVHVKRATPKADPKLRSTLSDLAAALLDSKDDAHIAELRNQVVELSNGESVQMDDEVHPTDKALKAAPALIRQWTASQIAAYLAFHADQVTDPAEHMVGALTELHDSNAAGVDPLIHTVSEEVTHIAVGNDTSKATPLMGKVSTWLKNNRDLTEEEISTKQASLEESARKVLGDVSPMDVLNHWVEEEGAILLANPELPDAIDAVTNAKQQATSTN